MMEKHRFTYTGVINKRNTGVHRKMARGKDKDRKWKVTRNVNITTEQHSAFIILQIKYVSTSSRLSTFDKMQDKITL